jgi:hypothetical protein
MRLLGPFSRPDRLRLVRSGARVTFVLVGAWLSAAASAAQTPDTSATATATATATAPADARGTLPFRKNQWGAEVTLFTGYAVGVLRFTAPNRAWLLDVAVSGHVSSSTDPDGQTRRSAGASARARVGRRGYRALLARTGSSSARAAAFGTVGGSVSGSRAGGNSPWEARFWSAGVGVFAEAGASAFVTDYLALNAAVEASIDGLYASQWYANVDGGRDKRIERQFRAGAGALRVFGSIFF